ncbi:MAG: chemotaxis protein CheW [Bacteroidales bacterium]|nr:chemotaxis protein CheW [Bacteroidales bacterium]
MNVETVEKISSYLSFKIGGEEYAAHVNDVLNILEVQEITKIPKAPGYLKGVINLRGMVLPVIDTHIKFGMEPIEFTDRTCIVVMDLDLSGEIIHVGALVDSVEAVHALSDDMIGPPPAIGMSGATKFIKGITRIDDHFVMLLDLVKLFTDDEIKELEKSIN